MLLLANTFQKLHLNTLIRTDVSGVIMDIHDGNTLLLDDGLYYYYGASYGLCKEPCTHSQFVIRLVDLVVFDKSL